MLHLGIGVMNAVLVLLKWLTSFLFGYFNFVSFLNYLVHLRFGLGTDRNVIAISRL